MSYPVRLSGNDKVQLYNGSLPAITANLSIITQSSEFFEPGADWQGILGLAYQALAQPDQLPLPWLDSLVQQGE